MFSESRAKELTGDVLQKDVVAEGQEQQIATVRKYTPANSGFICTYPGD